MAGARFTRAVRTALAWSEEGLYITVGLLLLAAAVLVIVGTVSGLITSIRTHQSAVDVGVVLLDRILLALIVAELLHTLRFVVLRGEIVVEPFLFVGLIAVVRRILIITAELEGQPPGGRALTNQLLELGLLGVLTLALAIAIYLVRRGGQSGYDPRDPARSSPLPTHQRDCGTTASGVVELDHLALPPGKPAKLVAEDMIEAGWRSAVRDLLLALSRTTVPALPRRPASGGSADLVPALDDLGKGGGGLGDDARSVVEIVQSAMTCCRNRVSKPPKSRAAGPCRRRHRRSSTIGSRDWRISGLRADPALPCFGDSAGIAAVDLRALRGERSRGRALARRRRSGRSGVAPTRSRARRRRDEQSRRERPWHLRRTRTARCCVGCCTRGSTTRAEGARYLWQRV